MLEQNIGIIYNTYMERIVLDTNVFISSLKSRRGASFRLLSLVGAGPFEIALSVPLVLEYEEVAKRSGQSIALSSEEIDAVIDYLCSTARLQDIYYLWRPLLKDIHDDHILELAVAAECVAIVTHNVKDFDKAEQFMINTLSPYEYLKRIGEIR